MSPGLVQNSHQVIGIDFDNTLATYDHLWHAAALEKSLIGPNIGKNKKDVRDAVRQLPGGEIEWQRLQGSVYGPGMSQARVSDGLGQFFQTCSAHQAKTYIISHKTEFANYDETHTNLRSSAMTWMTVNRFFEAKGLGLSPDNVFFLETRCEKLQCLQRLGCTYFIDDLEEVLLEKSFPSSVEKILYAPNQLSPELPGVTVAKNWEEIANHIFDA